MRHQHSDVQYIFGADRRDASEGSGASQRRYFDPSSRRGRMRAGKGLRDRGTSMQMVGVGAGVTDAGFSTKRRFEGDRRQLIRHHRRFWAAGTIAVPARVGDF